MVPIYGECPYPIWWSAIQFIPTIGFFIIFCHTIYATARFIKNRSNEKSSGCNTCLAYTIIVASTILSLAHMAYNSSLAFCGGTASKLEDITATLHTAPYVIQFYTLLILLYSKTNSIFIDTAFELSSCTRSSYKTIFIVIPIATILAWMVRYISTKILSIILIVVILFAILFLMISIIILTIYKLVHVYRETFKNIHGHDKNKNEPIVAAITKLTILSSMSIGITLVFFAVASYRLIAARDNLFVWYLSTALNILDVYTNFLSGVMCYSTFHEHYKIVCKCMDKRCRQCWSQIVNKQTPDMVHLERSASSITSENSDKPQLELGASSSSSANSVDIEV